MRTPSTAAPIIVALQSRRRIWQIPMQLHSSICRRSRLLLRRIEFQKRRAETTSNTNHRNRNKKNPGAEKKRSECTSSHCISRTTETAQSKSSAVQHFRSAPTRKEACGCTSTPQHSQSVAYVGNLDSIFPFRKIVGITRLLSRPHLRLLRNAELRLILSFFRQKNRSGLVCQSVR